MNELEMFEALKESHCVRKIASLATSPSEQTQVLETQCVIFAWRLMYNCSDLKGTRELN